MATVLEALWRLLTALQPYCPGLTGFLAGWEAQRARQAEKELDRVAKANHAAARVELLHTADVVRGLKQRGLYRVSGK